MSFERPAPAPDPRAPGAAIGITDAMIERLVVTFYARVRADAILGPVFEAAIADWDQHLLRMRDFWSSVTMMTGRYKGKPIPAHAALPDITEAHFLHWLALFRQTAAAVCPPDAAALFIECAERIARSLQLGIALHRGDLFAAGPVPAHSTANGEDHAQDDASRHPRAHSGHPRSCGRGEDSVSG